MVTVISRFRVRNGLEKEVREAFANRPRLVENAAGFCGIEVLTDSSDPSIFLLLTRWTDEESFRVWHRSEAHHQSHAWIPKGLKLDAAFTSVTVGQSIGNSSEIADLGRFLEGHSPAVSSWLMESDVVFVLLLAADGEILFRNCAGRRIFPPDAKKEFHSTIWDYLICSDGQHLRQRLLGPAQPDDGHLLLNLDNGQLNPVTAEVALLRCNGKALLLGAEEHRHDSRLQTEIQRLANDLSVMMRESVRKNRELQAANETIERLARTDALTGLANRRSLQDALQLEIARAGRSEEGFSLLMADLDHFKSINDRYGHVTGDEALVRTAAVIKGQCRSYDVAARYGGEEFALLLPRTSIEAAVAMGERIRKAIAEIDVSGCSGKITMSLGAASWIPDEPADALIARADAALYSAKHAGRNRVEAALSVRA